jgi:hypothetical protein
MGQCSQCKEFFGPEHMVESENKKTLICRFCRAGQINIDVYQGEGDDKQIVTIRKQECINKYKEFMNRMMKAETIRKQVLKDSIQGKS